MPLPLPSASIPSDGKTGRRCARALATLLLLFLLPHPSEGGRGPGGRVLLLHSYHKGLGWTDSLTDGIESVLRGRGRSVEIFVEYMDTKRHNEERYFRMLYDLYAYKFRNQPFDAVISSDDYAFRFLLQYHDRLFPGVPVVFCGVNDFHESSLAGRPLFTGVVEGFDVRKTLDLALGLHPDTKRVYVFADNTATGIANRAIARKALAGYGEKVASFFVGGLDLARIHDEDLSFPPDSIVLLMAFPRDRFGNVSEEFLPSISEKCNAPMYSVWDFFLGRGIVGGMLTNGFSQGEAAGTLALRILDGEPASTIAVIRESPNRFMFDFTQMKRFGIRPSDLPEGSVVINLPSSYYEEHKGLILGAAAVIVLLAAGVLALAVNVLRRKRAEETLRESEDRYRKLVETSPDAILLYSAEGRILMTNRRAAEMVGYDSAEDQVGRSAFDFIAPEDRARAAENLTTAFASDGIRREEYTLLRKDGSRCLTEVSISVVTDREKRPAALLAVIRDITERKRAEKALKESEHKFRMALEDSPIPVVLFDGTGSVLFANSRFAKLTGYADGAIRTLDEFAEKLLGNWDTAGSSLRNLGEGNEEQTVFDHGHRHLRTRTGEERIWEIQTSPIGSWGGREAVMLVGMDITEKIALERQLFQAQKMEAIGRLAGNLAHDINNYLGAVTGFAELAKFQRPTDGTLAKRMDAIVETSFRASSLIQQLLAFSRRQPAKAEVLCLNAVVEGLEKMLRQLIGDDIELDTRLAADLSNVKVDPSQVEQVLVNLLVNSRDAMPQGGRIFVETANVELDENSHGISRATESGRHVMLSVTDTGTGIPEEIRDKIFDPFFTTKEKGMGSGLGLSTVYGIVKQNGGYIWVYSQIGRGTTFKIYLPACDEEARPPAARPLRADTTKGGSEKILVVEDNDDVRDAVRQILEALGYRVLAVAGGEEALALLDRPGSDVDLLVTDVVMPGMGGMELMKQVQTRHEGLRILFISGYTQDVIGRHGILYEGIDFLAKPFSAADLSRKIREILD